MPEFVSGAGHSGRAEHGVGVAVRLIRRSVVTVSERAVLAVFGLEVLPLPALLSSVLR